MSALSVLNPTLLDLARATDPNGKPAIIAEILNLTNDVLTDMTWTEGNMTTGNRSAIRAGLPTATFRQLYQFVQPDKGTIAQVTDNCGMLEAYAVVDKALADMAPNRDMFRLQEDKAHIEAMNQKVATTIFYGNEGSEPAAFTGLSPRYNSLSAANAENIIDGGGTGTDNTSIWLVVWSPETVFGFVPKNSTAGIQVEDKGQVTLQSTSGYMEAYQSHYRWDVGLAVRDWRYAVRIANIDKSNLTKDASSGADLADLMFQAIDLIPSLQAGRASWYMSRRTLTFLRRQVANITKNSTLSIENVGGKRITSFQDIHIGRVDALAGDEARVI